MHILCIGLNHTTAPVHLRERLAFSEDYARATLAGPIRATCRDVTELLLLSTCNRTELYAVSSQSSFTALETFLSEAGNVPPQQFSPHLYRFTDMETVRHILNVAAGLDSLVLGEPQILGQISKAFKLAHESKAAGPLLSRLFQAAIHSGKRVRTETAIGHNPVSVSSLAANIAERLVEDIATAQVVILGAGEMAGLAVGALRKRGVEHIRVINRSPEHSQSLAEQWNTESATFEQLQDILADTDILIASTSAPGLLISAGMVKAAMQERPHRPLVLIDIAVPRNIDAVAGSIPGVHLRDIDHLNASLEQSLAERLAEVPQVEAILEQEEAELLAYLNSLSVLPLIAGLRQQAESIRAAELEKTLRRMPALSQTERAQLEALTRALVNKLLATPTSRLRAEAACPHAPKYAAVTRSLFNLPGEHGLCQFSGTVCPPAETFCQETSD